MEFIFAYGAGLLTLINPCVLPILPIVLAGSLQAGRAGPFMMAAGLSVSFVAFGMFVTTFGYAIGLDEQRIGMFAFTMDPAREFGGFADIRFTEFAASVATKSMHFIVL